VAKSAIFRIPRSAGNGTRDRSALIPSCKRTWKASGFNFVNRRTADGRAGYSEQFAVDIRAVRSP
jgi:hypothetical protein